MDVATRTTKTPPRASKSRRAKTVPSEERDRMIAENAYFRAEKRGFVGDPVQDWLAAEAEINARLSTADAEPVLPSPAQQKKELAAYNKLRKEMEEFLRGVRGQMNAETVKQALDKAAEALKDTKKYSTATINKVVETIKKDVADAAHKMGPKWEAFSDKTAGLFTVWRDRSSAFLSDAATAVSDWLEHVGRKREHQVYYTGEMSHKGTLECTACGEQVVLNKPAHLPACRKCGKREFRRL